MTEMTSKQTERNTGGKTGRAFITFVAGATFALLIATAYFATAYERGTGLSQYEIDAIEVVAMQNDITSRWNEAVEAFNDSTVVSPQDHVALFSVSQETVRVLITDSQAVINRWNDIEVPAAHTGSHELGRAALMATQDGLILFDVYFQNSLDTMVADQLKAEEAAAKLVYARDLWEQAAQAAANEG